MIKVENLAKSYPQAAQRVEVFTNLSLTVEKGEFVALMGASGAGKSTLLQLLGCLDKPSSGSYKLDGTETARLDETALAAVRNRKIGFVFQNSHFVDYLDLVENVSLPGLYSDNSVAKELTQRATALLKRVGLGHRLKHKPAELSGGERQRATIARALFNRPKLLLADEPTGNLDAKNAQHVMDILKELNDGGLTILVVTHDAQIADRAGSIVELIDGVLKQYEIH